LLIEKEDRAAFFVKFAFPLKRFAGQRHYLRVGRMVEKPAYKCRN
jgi:hypothetical protein